MTNESKLHDINGSNVRHSGGANVADVADVANVADVRVL